MVAYVSGGDRRRRGPSGKTRWRQSKRERIEEESASVRNDRTKCINVAKPPAMKWQAPT